MIADIFRNVSTRSLAEIDFWFIFGFMVLVSISDIVRSRRR